MKIVRDTNKRFFHQIQKVGVKRNQFRHDPRKRDVPFYKIKVENKANVYEALMVKKRSRI